MIVVSKIGYVQGSNLRLAREREAAGQPFPEMVKYGEGVWHCIHPEFLEDQLGRALARLGLQTLDVCLLHNPEYFLTDAHERSHGTLEKRREEFYRRLRAAFEYLESQAAAGRIRWYGVSSNTCTRPPADPEFTSLSRMLEAARGAGGEGHRLRVLQLPLNLFEAGAVLERNNGEGLGETVLEHASRTGIAVLANRPLNALVSESMLRLADVEVGGGEVDLDERLAAVRELEGDYRRDIAIHLRAGEGSPSPDQFFRWGSELAEVAPQLDSLEHWEHIEGERVLPVLVSALQALDRALTGSLAERWKAWRERYVPALQSALEELRRRAALRSREVAQAVAALLDPLLPAERRPESLSRKALWVVAGTPGVSCVLNGMRREPYVDDALAIMPWPPLADAERVYQAVQQAPRPVPSRS